MNWIDFLIGFTMVNGVPHFILGIYGCRMLSLFGYSRWGNIAYGLLNTVVSIGLFLYQYGVDGIWQNGIFVGGMFIVVAYILTGKLVHYLFHTKHFDSR